jgi:hypothetical protein
MKMGMKQICPNCTLEIPLPSIGYWLNARCQQCSQEYVRAYSNTKILILYLSVWVWLAAYIFLMGASYDWLVLLMIIPIYFVLIFTTPFSIRINQTYSQQIKKASFILILAIITLLMMEIIQNFL